MERLVASFMIGLSIYSSAEPHHFILAYREFDHAALASSSG
jgi:hypothetical protein